MRKLSTDELAVVDAMATKDRMHRAFDLIGWTREGIETQRLASLRQAFLDGLTPLIERLATVPPAEIAAAELRTNFQRLIELLRAAKVALTADFASAESEARVEEVERCARRIEDSAARRTMDDGPKQRRDG